MATASISVPSTPTWLQLATIVHDAYGDKDVVHNWLLFLALSDVGTPSLSAEDVLGGDIRRIARIALEAALGGHFGRALPEDICGHRHESFVRKVHQEVSALEGVQSSHYACGRLVRNSWPLRLSLEGRAIAGVVFTAAYAEGFYARAQSDNTLGCASMMALSQSDLGSMLPDADSKAKVAAILLRVGLWYPEACSSR